MHMEFWIAAGSFLLGGCVGVLLTCLVQCAHIRGQVQAEHGDRQ